MSRRSDRGSFTSLISGWRDVTIVAVVALVFAIPAVLLVGGPKPSPLSFQMYSGYGAVSATWTGTDGQRHRVDLGDLIVSGRVEIDWTTFLPEEICRRTPDAARAEVSRVQPGGVQRRSVTC